MPRRLAFQAEFRDPSREESDAACTLGQLAEALLDLGLSIDESNDLMLDLMQSGRLRLTNLDKSGSEDNPIIH